MPWISKGKWTFFYTRNKTTKKMFTTIFVWERDWGEEKYKIRESAGTVSSAGGNSESDY